MRRVDSTLEIKSFFASKAFKIVYKNNNAFLTKIKNLELRLVYEDDPDFFKQNLETSTKIISAWNTPHRRIDSIKSCYSNSILRNENSELVFFLFITFYLDDFLLIDFYFVE